MRNLGLDKCLRATSGPVLNLKVGRTSWWRKSQLAIALIGLFNQHLAHKTGKGEGLVSLRISAYITMIQAQSSFMKSLLNPIATVTRAFPLLCILVTPLTLADVKLTVSYEKPINAQEVEIQRTFQSSEAIQSLISRINEDFRLTAPLNLTFGGEDGPLFDGEQNSIRIPYSFDAEVRERFNADNYDETGVSIEQAVEDAMLHTLLHEFGHALVKQFELPVIGKEEDAVDTLATVLLIDYFEDGQQIALSAADLFALESEGIEELTEEDYQDEHSLDAQRYYHTACLVYGSDPEQYTQLIGDLEFSEERSELCIEEYESARDSWYALLEPYMNSESEAVEH